ncbi:MAG: glutathione S-transferase family protein [Phenylobacterium sp.]|uniref:glutathione S-transferase family protein n=1 Tax=Phenylobacterium sp. TaxID=1871053 RepID=UPI0025E97555|nr:glutathione S-transferase family protein [Phenylobacterium sp.]MCA6250848.1 glutathione S-transferase family protein [Phenylobacterium sp.]MCA6257971.1 glutathione S-transferase family protein [Phenylobacterium sp.]MCA6265801.1 glutathione S-transferase family protein [Phenylobacterium sp.]MCA6273937.1 glutathione S-transferase family protein [Phenylobacterium sp.]MCA6330816.1 glutathione S-transferase family protein [Phenylobacterium sp.]
MDLILHHYDASPFSEKVRIVFGMTGQAWSSVITPNMMPKPDLTPLTGGYRRAPVLQAGADVYCDSMAILDELQRRTPLAGDRGLAGLRGIGLWADRLFFQATVPVIFGEMGHLTPKAFIADREKLSGRPFDVEAMAQAAGPMRIQWRGHASWLDYALEDAPFLAGDRPGLADASAWMNIWWLKGALPDTYDRLTVGLDRLEAWRRRMADIGHGVRKEITGAEALAIAKSVRPADPPAHDPNDALGLSPGDAVVVMADDYGRDPIAGTLVAARHSRLILAQETPDLGRLHLHFPRVGYVALSGQS